MRPFTWSYSALTAFETCPRRYFLTRISKQAQEVQTKETLWGNRVHKAMELRVGRGTPLPEDMKDYEKIAAPVAAQRQTGAKIAVEQKLALTANFRPTEYFSKNVWLRSVADVILEKKDSAVVLDHKTGKKKPDSQQLKLSAAVVFATKPYIQKITCSFLWLTDGSNTTEKFEREDAPGIWQDFAPRVKRMEEAIKLQKFPPNPSGLCRKWCPVGKALCDHCGE
jgi:hypothetical protein